MNTEGKFISKMKMLSLIGTFSILLSGCNEFKDLSWISCKPPEQVLAVIPQQSGIVALGTSNNLYVLMGTSKQLIKSKLVSLPAGLALNVITGKVGRFSIREFVLTYKVRFPELLSDGVVKAMAAQEQVFKQQRIEVPKQEIFNVSK